MRVVITSAILLMLLGLPGAVAMAQVTSVVTFDSGKFGWSWGVGPNEWIELTGGNPGAYLHGDICCPYWPYAFNTSSFVGNYQYFGIASLGIDLLTLQNYASLDPTGGRRLALMLLNDNDTPRVADDWGAFVLGSDAPTVGAGWLSYDFLVLAQETALPPGWNMWHTTVNTWAELIQDVDEVRFIFGDPTLNYVESSWVVGMDNVRFTKEEPGRVPPDMVMERAALGWVNLIWNAPGGCGHPEDYAIYEGEIGDWGSHSPVVCTDAQNNREERILASAGDRYYLVIPLGSDTEGSYGLNSKGEQRPPGDIVTCRPSQSLTCS